MLLLLLCASRGLSPVPSGLNEFSRTAGRAGTLNSIRRTVAAAAGRALADGVELMEVEFPPLLESKTQFDDFSNVEVLDANRDFGVQLALETQLTTAAPDAALWLIFADDGEAELAREAVGNVCRRRYHWALQRFLCFLAFFGFSVEVESLPFSPSQRFSDFPASRERLFS